MARQTVFYRSLSGREPVREWIESLGQDDQKHILIEIKTLLNSPVWSEPYVKYMAPYRGLYELRLKVRSIPWRIFFCVSGSNVVFLLVFQKRTQQTPDRELRLAVKRQKEVCG